MRAAFAAGVALLLRLFAAEVFSARLFLLLSVVVVLIFFAGRAGMQSN
jgi:hypothetical protein